MDISYHSLEQESLRSNHSFGQLDDVKCSAEQKNKECDGEFHTGRSMSSGRVAVSLKLCSAQSRVATVILRYEMICIGRQTGKLNFFLPAYAAECFSCPGEKMVLLNHRVCAPEALYSRVAVL